MPESRPKVLHVDDRRIVLKYYQEFLEKAGAESVPESTITQAEGILAQGGITAILSDGLHGNWKRLLLLAEQYDIPKQNFAILTISPLSYAIPATEAGVHLIDKGKSQDECVSDLIKWMKMWAKASE